MIIHPTCPTSKSIILSLKEKGIIEKINIIVLDKPTPLPNNVFPWAVPMLIDKEGSPIAMDPINAEEVEAYLNGEDYDIGDEIAFFKKSILYSAYASSIVLAHHSVKPLIQESFLYPALRVKQRNRNMSEWKRLLEERHDEIYEDVKETVARALSLAIVRFYYYSGVREWERIAEIDAEDVSSVILAMASIGRSHLPIKPLKPDMADYIAGFISKSARGLLKKIEKEYHETVEDKEYVEMISKFKYNNN